MGLPEPQSPRSRLFLQQVLYCALRNLGTLYRVRSRRLEDRIRDLCAKVAAAPQAELQTAITNLRAALREHALRIENKATKDLLKGPGKPDRRKR